MPARGVRTCYTGISSEATPQETEMDRFDPRQDRTYTVEVLYTDGSVRIIEHLTYQQADRYFGTGDPSIVSVDLYSEAD